MGRVLKGIVIGFAATILFVSCEKSSGEQKSVSGPQQSQEDFEKERAYLSKFPIVSYTPTETSFDGVPAKDFSSDWKKILVFSETNVNPEQKSYFSKYELTLTADMNLGGALGIARIIVGCFEAENGETGSFVAATTVGNPKRVILSKQILTKPYLLFLHPKDGILQLDYKFENHPLQILSVQEGKVVFEDVEI